ncbi:MAG: class C beta-lactamase-related serine hydrolase [Balneolaceae bacterium]|nr:MAG: class C beta-lactamase-related serine hydrolase [Balneolaceae bacterium]
MKPRIADLIIILFISLFWAGSGTPLMENSKSDPDILDEIFHVGSVQTILIEKSGELIAERYEGRLNGNRAVNTKSASKSILSLLVGVAIDKGYLEGVGQTIDEFFPDYFAQNPDSEKESITIKDLLTMRSGLETTSIRNYGRWVVSSNWSEYALSRPMVDKPGGRMIYSTGTSHLLSVILTRASGMSTRELANRYLFEPMNIQIGGWDRDPQGYYMGGNNMAMRPPDMIKIGRMMMDSGVYNGERVVSAEWIKESVEIYTRSNFNPYDFGYMWWRRPVNGYEMIFAWGHGGQYIMMLPELDTVIVITSNLMRNEGRGYQRELFRYMEERLVPFLAEI